MNPFNHFKFLLLCPVLLETARVMDKQNLSDIVDHQNDQFEAQVTMGPRSRRHHERRSGSSSSNSSGHHHRRSRHEPCYGELSGLALHEGREVDSAPDVSAEECKQKCSSNANCQSVSYSPGLHGCWLKDRSFNGQEETKVIQDFKTYYKAPCNGHKGARQSQAKPPKVCYDQLSGLALVEGGHVDAAPGASLEECQQKCSDHSDCESISYCPEWKGCWLKTEKHNAGDATRSLFATPKACRTYFKVRQLDVDQKETCYDELSGFAVTEGHNVDAVPGVSAEECKQKCSDSAKCQSISYSPGLKGCWLKDRSFSGDEETREFQDFKTYYKAPCNGCNGARRRRTKPMPQGLWQSSGKSVGPEEWCRAEVPVKRFELKSACNGNTDFKVLSFNLKWWDVFGNRNGDKVGEVIQKTGPYDIMGFQECNDVNWVLRLAKLTDTHVPIQADYATAIAYRRSTWEMIESGKETVAEDNRWQYYGYRGVGWVRLRHLTTGNTVFFMNHHGPLQVDTGGKCGGMATAYNLLKVIAVHAQADDLKIFLGDLNAQGHSETQSVLKKYMHNVTSNWVDAIFATCAASAKAKSLGNGGSDHIAIEASFRI